MAVKITQRMMEKGQFAVHQFLEDRFPDSAQPRAVQLFADPGDHLDPEFKHEKGCNDLARAVLTAALTRSNAKKP